MTSRISFFKIMRDDMKKLSWLTAFQGLVFFLCIPFRVLVELASRVSQEYYIENPGELTEVFCQSVGLGRTENIVLVMLAGALCALVAFGYLHSPAKLDFYHSLPLTRERLFASKLFGSSLTFLVAYACSQVLGVLVGLLYNVVPAGAVLEVAAATLQGILCFFCSYAGTLLAIMLTGRLLTSVLAVGVLGLYFPMLILVEMMCKAEFLQTSLNGSSWELRNDLLGCTSPWAFGFTRLGNYDGARTEGLTGYWPDTGSLCQMAAVAIIFLLICAALYRIRRTEAAGNALAFPKLEGVVKVLLSIPVAIVAGTVAYEMFDSVLWEGIFILLFGILSCVVMEFIYRGDIRQVTRHRGHVLTTVIFAGALFFLARFDVMGYNTYLPEKENIQAMAVDGNFLNYTYFIDGEVYRFYDSATAARKILDYLEMEEDIDDLYRIAENGVANVKDGTEGKDIQYVNIKYRTKDEKEIYRSYLVDSDLFFEIMNERQKDEEFREKHYPILTWDDAYISKLYSGCGYMPMDYLEEPAGLNDPQADGESEEPGSGAGTLETEEAAESAEAVGTSETEDAIDSADGGASETEEVTESAESAGVSETEDAIDSAEYEEAYSYEETTYDMYSVDIPAARIGEVIEAYRKDLETVSFEDLWLASGSLELSHEMDEVFKGAYTFEMYPLSENFTNTLEALRKIDGGQS